LINYDSLHSNNANNSDDAHPETIKTNGTYTTILKDLLNDYLSSVRILIRQLAVTVVII